MSEYKTYPSVRNLAARGLFIVHSGRAVSVLTGDESTDESLCRCPRLGFPFRTCFASSIFSTILSWFEIILCGEKKLTSDPILERFGVPSVFLTGVGTLRRFKALNKII